ncbi:MAG: hypothetical protein RIQ60_4107 [Pseudomonadota bacterium]|jgi:hypothetical protein
MTITTTSPRRPELPRPATYLLSFVDSEIATVLDEGEVLRLRFAAAHVDLLPSAHAGTTPDTVAAGYLSGLELLLWPTARPLGDAPPASDLLGRIASGQIEQVRGDEPRAGLAALRRVQVPVVLEGPLTLRLDFANRSSLQLGAHRAEFRLDADARFREALSC